MKFYRSLDPFGRLLCWAIIGFVVLSLPEVYVGLSPLKPALFVDGGHNVLEIMLLGLNLQEHRRRQSGHEESSVPVFTAISTTVLAIPTAMIALSQGQTESDVTLAAILALVSLIFNLVVTWRLHCTEVGGMNAKSVQLHLLSDAAIAGTALAAYSLIGLGASVRVDPILTLVGCVVVMAINLGFVHRHAH